MCQLVLNLSKYINLRESTFFTIQISWTILWRKSFIPVDGLQIFQLEVDLRTLAVLTLPLQLDDGGVEDVASQPLLSC